METRLSTYLQLKQRINNTLRKNQQQQESTTQYENNLWQSGYNKKLTYKPTDTNHQKHSKHEKKII